MPYDNFDPEQKMVEQFGYICDLKHPRKLVGRSFKMTIGSGYDSFYAEGTFNSFSWSPELGFQFFISIPEYKDRAIRYVAWDAHQWSLRLADIPDTVSALKKAHSNHRDEETLLQELDIHRFVAIIGFHFKGL